MGCGATKRLDENTAEVKRLYVDPTTRARGVGRRLLAALEDRARETGLAGTRLDTGDNQPVALALFRAAGYREIPDYNGNPYATYWMENRLQPESGFELGVAAGVYGERAGAAVSPPPWVETRNASATSRASSGRGA